MLSTESLRNSLPLNKEVILTTGTKVLIPKLKTGEYYGVIMALEDLPSKLAVELGVDPLEYFSNLNGVSAAASVLALLPKMLAIAFDETVNLVAVASKIPLTTLRDETYGEDFIAIVSAVLEVNNVEQMAKMIKNLVTRLRQAGVIKAKKIRSVSNELSPSSSPMASPKGNS